VPSGFSSTSPSVPSFPDGAAASSSSLGASHSRTRRRRCGPCGGCLRRLRGVPSPSPQLAACPTNDDCLSAFAVSAAAGDSLTVAQCIRPPASCSSCFVSRGSPEHRRPRTTVRRWLGAPFFVIPLLAYCSVITCNFFIGLTHSYLLPIGSAGWSGIVSVGLHPLIPPQRVSSRFVPCSQPPLMSMRRLHCSVICLTEQ